MRRTTRLALVILGMALVSAPAGTQTIQQPASGSATARPPVDPDPSARLVRIDAVVTDRQGRPLLDLGPGDFQVVENGVVQHLDAVELRRVVPPAAAPAAIISTDQDEESAAREPGTRVLALLLDEFHVSPGPNTAHAREALLRFVQEHVRPADLVTVLKPLDPLTRIRFTRGGVAARAQIEAFSGRKGEYEARSEFEERYIGRAPAAVQAARAQIVLAGLRALTLRLTELNAGRAAILLVSEGFTRTGGRDGIQRVPDVQGLVRAASRSLVAMYALNPDGAPPPGSDAEEPDRAWTFLQALARETGGESARGALGIEQTLARAARDLDGYYVLSYTSSHDGDGRFYDVQVRTRRQDGIVRTRTGYWAPVRTDLMLGSDRRPAAPMRALRKSPLIETWLGLTFTEGVQHVTFTWAPADLRGRPRHALQQPSFVTVKVTTQAGAVLYDGEVVPPRSGSAGVREDAAWFEAPPGRIQVDLEIFGADGARLDFAAQDVDVPNVNRADPVILPPQVFHSTSAREFRVISSDPTAAPEPGRAFRRTERLLVRVPTHSPSSSRVTVQARVLNRTGQTLREIPPMRETPGAVTQFDVPLSWLAPGEYAIELSASSSAGQAKEMIRIRVTG